MKTEKHQSDRYKSLRERLVGVATQRLVNRQTTSKGERVTEITSTQTEWGRVKGTGVERQKQRHSREMRLS